jgi:nucleoside 2-deoxyribosyltransferase
MLGKSDRPLLLGEISIDFTFTGRGEENKLRMGGVAHAARGFWAEGQPFDAAVVLPKYLAESAEGYFRSLGCVDFHIIAEIESAPNVTIIADATEVSDQGYDTLLRFEKTVRHLASDDQFQNQNVLIFPGAFDLPKAIDWLAKSASLTLDIAYDVGDLAELNLGRPISAILISTSSQLFLEKYSGDIERLRLAAKELEANYLILKENRGGSRAIDLRDNAMIPLHAQLGQTVNSVGVGDVFAASFLVYADNGLEVAGCRATMAATAYSRTTYPDDFREMVHRYSKLDVADLRALGGTHLPWESRQSFDIYLAAPDFSYQDNPEIDRAIDSLAYHNFKVRRPVRENGELPQNSSFGMLRRIFHADVELLRRCSVVFAIPNSRDAGTLVEMGMAMSMGIPVITYDPRGDAGNTMVIAGSTVYSSSLDECLNTVFNEISKICQR